MTRAKTVVVLGLLIAALGWSRVAGATLCFMDAKDDGTGKAVKWPNMPVTYKINASKVPAGDKAPFIDAVKKAFASWSKTVSCTNIEFTYGGETDSVAQSAGEVLVLFSDTDNGSAYFTFTDIPTYDPPDISDGLIQLHLKITFSGTVFGYSVGAQQNKFDVQTAVKNLIPHILGFCLQVDAQHHCVIPDSEWKTNYVNTALLPDQEAGARYTYFQAGSGCTQTTEPPACFATNPPPREAGPAVSDGGVNPGTDGPKPSSDGAASAGDGRPPSGDFTLPPPSNDDGCCRVGHTTSESGRGLLALAGLGLLLALGLRRRSSK